MKISYMLRREDFYSINQKTLDKYYKEKHKSKTLYIYPHLNAIVTRTPSKRVKQYLYVEYSHNASLIKHFLTKMYTRIYINSFGLLSSSRCRVNGDFSDNSLIYPCNKKIRIFDFDSGTVRVVAKAGFCNTGIKKEIEFRKTNNASFIPKVLSFDDEEYTEKIIDGRPLARIKEGQELYKEAILNLWNGYKRDSKDIAISEYAKQLREEFAVLIKKCTGKSADFLKAHELEEHLYALLAVSSDMTQVALSHGDLQPGNVWIENNTDNIYIIDWESYGRRSVGYDYAALYRDLRKKDGISRLAKSNAILDVVILYEDLIFKLEELSSLPEDIGSGDFDDYVNTVLREIKNV